jgi:hypothetical protein
MPPKPPKPPAPTPRRHVVVTLLLQNATPLSVELYISLDAAVAEIQAQLTRGVIRVDRLQSTPILVPSAQVQRVTFHEVIP